MEEYGKWKQVLVDVMAGAISGGVSRTVVAPLDVIKIRFQVQIEPTFRLLYPRSTYGVSKYTGMLQATKDILREEGMLGLWRGNVPGLLLWMPYTAIQFAVLRQFKLFAEASTKAEDHAQLSPYFSYLSGGLAGYAATMGSYPFDLLRTVLASQGEPKVYPNLRSAFLGITRTKGIQGLYAGLSPTLVVIVPYAALQFGSNDTFKRWCQEWNQARSRHAGVMSEERLSGVQLSLCGFAAGMVAKVATNPLDVVKKRFQVEGLERHPKYGARVDENAYKGMWHALRRIFQEEGLAGLYKGVVPSVIKAAPASAVTFVVYEYTIRWIEHIIR